MNGLQRSIGNRQVAALVASGRIHRVPDGMAKGSYAGGTVQSGGAASYRSPPASPEEAKIQSTQISLLDKAKAIKKIGESVNDLSEKLTSKGTHWFWSNDEDLIDLGKSVNSVHKSVNEIAEGLTTLSNAPAGDVLKGSITAQEDLEKILNAAETLSTISSTQDKFDAFAKKPNLENANAWATGIGATFSNVAQYIPTGALPGFMGQYIKGLFGAPAVYIAAFQGYSAYHYGRIDKETGNLAEDEKKLCHGKQVQGGAFKGLLCDLFLKAGSTFGIGQGLAGYMQTHQKIGAVNLFYVDSVESGTSVLVGCVTADPALTEEQRSAYLQVLNPSPAPVAAP
jgi:hypothetical protein